jgi:hypothetical protein
MHFALRELVIVLTGSAGVSPAIEREARKACRTTSKTARLRRVAGETPALPVKSRNSAPNCISTWAPGGG